MTQTTHLTGSQFWQWKAGAFEQEVRMHLKTTSIFKSIFGLLILNCKSNDEHGTNHGSKNRRCSYATSYVVTKCKGKGVQCLIASLELRLAKFLIVFQIKSPPDHNSINPDHNLETPSIFKSIFGLVNSEL